MMLWWFVLWLDSSVSTRATFATVMGDDNNSNNDDDDDDDDHCSNDATCWRCQLALAAAAASFFRKFSLCSTDSALCRSSISGVLNFLRQR